LGASDGHGRSMRHEVSMGFSSACHPCHAGIIWRRLSSREWLARVLVSVCGVGVAEVGDEDLDGLVFHR
jgi:hypothetical protein